MGEDQYGLRDAFAQDQSRVSPLNRSSRLVPLDVAPQSTALSLDKASATTLLFPVYELLQNQIQLPFLPTVLASWINWVVSSNISKNGGL